MSKELSVNGTSNLTDQRNINEPLERIVTFLMRKVTRISDKTYLDLRGINVPLQESDLRQSILNRLIENGEMRNCYKLETDNPYVKIVFLAPAEKTEIVRYTQQAKYPEARTQYNQLTYNLNGKLCYDEQLIQGDYSPLDKKAKAELKELLLGYDENNPLVSSLISNGGTYSLHIQDPQRTSLLYEYEEGKRHFELMQSTTELSNIGAREGGVRLIIDPEESKFDYWAAYKPGFDSVRTFEDFNKRFPNFDWTVFEKFMEKFNGKLNVGNIPGLLGESVEDR